MKVKLSHYTIGCGRNSWETWNIDSHQWGIFSYRNNNGQEPYTSTHCTGVYDSESKSIVRPKDQG